MLQGIKAVINAIRKHFTDEKKLERQFVDLRRASMDVVESKARLDETIAKHEEDEFQRFAEHARKSRF